MSQFFVNSASSGNLPPQVPTSFVTTNSNLVPGTPGATATPAANVLTVNATSVQTNSVDGIQAAATGSTIVYELTNRIQGSVNTSDATPTTLLTFPFNTNTGPGTYLFDMDTIAYNVTDGLSAAYSSKFCVRYDGANGNLVVPPDQFNPEEINGPLSMVPTNVTYASTGSPVLTVTCTGIAGKTIHWLTSGKYIYVS